jgi:hypothetical protein
MNLVSFSFFKGSFMIKVLVTHKGAFVSLLLMVLTVFYMG